MNRVVVPGRHPQVKLYGFTSEEQQVIGKLSKEWYVTRSGTVTMGNKIKSSYNYLLMKATQHYSEMFNIEREIIVIFSAYPDFEPRALDSIDEVVKMHQTLRIERICSVFISKDNNIGSKISDLLMQDKELQIVVPFSYDELQSNDDSFFLINRFKKHFFSRDLFSFQSALKKDLYFFGRRDIVHDIISRHHSNENSGLFGLRKSGKTSVIYGVQRALARDEDVSIVIDCQDTSFNRRRWNEALHFIVNKLKDTFHLSTEIRPENEYTEKNAAILFREDIQKLHRKLGDKQILIFFDEIENITFNISASTHWAHDNDFIFFWQSIRSSFQALDNIFSYCIVGTNPMCVEKSSINGKDNPIYNSVPFYYIERFGVSQTQDMVSKLGNFMGLRFDDVLFAKLTEDYGGHPFLIRQLCSYIHLNSNGDRPTNIDRILYNNCKQEFEDRHSDYFEMVLDVLERNYPDEYEMLKQLALGDIDFFHTLAENSPEYTNHLIGYGIIEKNQRGQYDFRIDAINKYLLKKNKFKKMKLTKEEKISEISERRNLIEPKIRKIIKSQLLAQLGQNKAKANVLKIYAEPRSKKYQAISYKDLFDPNICEIYFRDLTNIISKEWPTFKNIFGKDLSDFE